MSITYLIEKVSGESFILFFDTWFIKKGTMTRLNSLNKTLVQKDNELHLVFGFRSKRLTLIINWG